MEMTMRPMTGMEQMYCYTQSQQIMAVTGCIGHLRGDLDSTGEHSSLPGMTTRHTSKPRNSKMNSMQSSISFVQTGPMVHFWKAAERCLTTVGRVRKL